MIPLSYAQRRLWFLYKLEGPSATYNVPLALRLSGRVDVGALRAAGWGVGGRHESLRAVFPEVDGKPGQRVLELAEVDLCWRSVVVSVDGLAGALVEAART